MCILWLKVFEFTWFVCLSRGLRCFAFSSGADFGTNMILHRFQAGRKNIVFKWLSLYHWIGLLSSNFFSPKCDIGIICQINNFVILMLVNYGWRFIITVFIVNRRSVKDFIVIPVRLILIRYKMISLLSVLSTYNKRCNFAVNIYITVWIRHGQNLVNDILN